MRVASALFTATQSMVAPLVRAARQLFHEATGALFAVFAVVGVAGTWREWNRGGADWRVAVAVAFTMLMGVCAVLAFRSAHRIR